MLCRGEGFEGHEVETNAAVDQLRHRPRQVTKRKKPDGVWQDRGCSYGGLRDGRVGPAERSGQGSRYRTAAERPAQPVVPQPGREDLRTGVTKRSWLFVEQDLQEQVVVDDYVHEETSGEIGLADRRLGGELGVAAGIFDRIAQ